MRCDNCGEQNSDSAKFCQACGAKLAALEPEAEAPVESRKTVSLVFCDLTGSTALGDKMDPEALRRVITRYFNEMRQVLVRHGGTVEKFIGDAVMAAFGVPTVHEDDALRAVRAALEMQQTMEEMNLDLELEWGVGLQARIGVNTGEVIAGDPSAGHGFVSGDAVNVAARLEQAAPPGSILIGVDTYRLVRDAVHVEEVEPLELKGKPEPVPAYKVTGVIPHALGVSRNLEAPLIGRDRELALIAEAFDRTHTQGSCELVTLFGPAGAGKSRVTAEFIDRIEGDVTVLQGRCLPYGEGITYFPIAEAIKEAAGIDVADSSSTAMDKIARYLDEGDEATMIRERIAALIGLAEDVLDNQELFWAVRKFLEALARTNTVIVVLDDMHWAEPTFLDLVEYLAGFAQGMPILILCLARKDLLDSRPGWGQDGASVLLEPLTPEQVHQLISNLVGESAGFPEVARRRIVEAAEGNPLYVEEILRMMIDDRVLERQEGHWVLMRELEDVSVPPTIHALVAARLDRLAPQEHAVAQRASVIGKTFWWGAVTHLSPDAARPRVGHHLQTLTRKELVAPDTSTFAGEDAFRFAHTMIRDASYQGMSKEIRAELHDRFAGWLLERVGDREREYEEILGYHFEQAFKLRDELGHADERMEELRREAVSRLSFAATRAYRRTDMPAAANLLGRSARLLEIRDPERAELTLLWIDALVELGELAQAKELAEQVKKVGKAIKNEWIEARADLEAARLSSYTDVEGWRDRARSEMERITPILQKHDDHSGLALGLWLVAQSYWDEYKLSEAEKALEDGLLHVREGGERSHYEGKILSALSAVLLWGPAHSAKAAEIADALIEQSGGNLTVQAYSRLRTGVLKAMLGEFEEARELIRGARAAYEELGQSFPLVRSSHEAGMMELFADDAVAAEKEFRAGIAGLEAMGEKAYLASSVAMLGRALLAQERWDEAIEATKVSEESAGDDPSMKGEWGPVRAVALANKGELEAAEKMAREALEVAAQPEDVLIRGYALLGLGEVLLAAGKAEEAKPVLDEALALFEGKGVVSLVAKIKGLQEN